MNTTTPADAATWLRSIADLLARCAPVPLTVHLSLDVSQYRTTLTESERIAAVGAVASALGLTASSTKVTSFWEHVAQRNDGGFLLSVITEIAGPQLCACGAACTHNGRPTVVS